MGFSFFGLVSEKRPHGGRRLSTLPSRPLPFSGLVSIRALFDDLKHTMSTPLVQEAVWAKEKGKNAPPQKDDKCARRSRFESYSEVREREIRKRRRSGGGEKLSRRPSAKRRASPEKETLSPSRFFFSLPLSLSFQRQRQNKDESDGKKEKKTKHL